MGVIVFVKNFSILEEVGLTPACQIEPRFRVERVPISGIPMLIDAGGDPSIVKWLFRSKAVEDNSVVVGSFGKLGCHLSRVNPLIHVDLDRALHRGQPLPSIVQMIPWGLVPHAPYERGLRTE